MKLSDFFPVFENLPAQDDAELYEWITRSCHKKSAPNYIDETIDILRLWLRAVTRCQWIRSHQHGQRDGVDPDFQFADGQYGTVEYLRSERTNYPDRICDILDEGSGDFCQVSAVQLRFIFRLNVFRDAGEATTGQENQAIQTPIGSAPDVLLNLHARQHLSIFREAMRQKGFFMEDEPFRMLQAPPVEKQSRWEWVAAGEFSLIATVTGSVRVSGANDINIEYCENLV